MNGSGRKTPRKLRTTEANSLVTKSPYAKHCNQVFANHGSPNAEVNKFIANKFLILAVTMTEKLQLAVNVRQLFSGVPAHTDFIFEA
jgi:hypothetical protein